MKEVTVTYKRTGEVLYKPAEFQETLLTSDTIATVAEELGNMILKKQESRQAV